MTSRPSEIPHRHCPICGRQGKIRRKKSPAELRSLYKSYLDVTLPDDLAQKYLRNPITELRCGDCDLLWYDPAIMGESDYYEFLSTLEWYYRPNSWDKRIAAQILVERGATSVVEVGCGSGELIKTLNARGIDSFGTELNQAVLDRARIESLPIYSPKDKAIEGRTADSLISLQSLEHLLDPVDWMREQISLFQPRNLIIAVPAHDTALGRSSDPLCWPPHHFTQWSGRAMARLADTISFEIVSITYQMSDWPKMNWYLDKEPSRSLFGIPSFPKGRIGRSLHIALKALGVPWAARSHSVLAVMQRSKRT